MMERAVHITPKDLLRYIPVKNNVFGEIALLCGVSSRIQRCLPYLSGAKKNFSFMGCAFWTGTVNATKITIGVSGAFSAQAAMSAELLYACGVKSFIRMGTCGSLQPDLNIGDVVIADKLICGEGVSPYYIGKEKVITVDAQLRQRFQSLLSGSRSLREGGVWTTDAIFRETKEVVTAYTSRGAIAVDMVSAALGAVARFHQASMLCVLVVSDNLMTGEYAFASEKVVNAENEIIELLFTRYFCD